MNVERHQAVIIGGGPAGLAAAIRLRQKGVDDVVVLEREHRPGGILRQCIHDGFGLQRFQQRMAGCEYAQRFINEVRDTDITVMLGTMVLELTSSRVLYACNEQSGMMEIECGAVILAMGCRERTASQVLIYGTRPAVMTPAGRVP